MWIQFTFFHTAPERVTGVRVFDNQAVLWELPNGKVTSYQLTFTRGQDINRVTTTLPYHVILSQDIPGSSGSFTVQVTIVTLCCKSLIGMHELYALHMTHFYTAYESGSMLNEYLDFSGIFYKRC